MSRVYNFSAGPAVLPECVLQEAAAEMMDYRGTGMSVMEMSHRSKPYQTIIDEAEADPLPFENPVGPIVFVDDMIDRHHDMFHLTEMIEDFPLGISVIAHRDVVDPEGEELTVDLVGDPLAMGGVLAVYDHQIRVVFLHERIQKRRDTVSSAFSYDIS